MNNPGCYNLASLPIAAALAAVAQVPQINLDGMTAVTLRASFQYGSGGSACVAVVQTSLDGGNTWDDIARFDFATVSANKRCNLEGVLSVAVSDILVLGSPGVQDGHLGNRLRCVVTSTGTYANTTLSVRASVR